MSEPAAAGGPGAAQAETVPLRHNRGFRMLWIGQVLSDTGSEAALIAYPLLILALTGSAAIAGAVGTVRLVAQLILGLPGGALADRFDRRLTMIACDSIRAAVLGLLAGLVLAHLVTWPVVVVVSVIDGAANSLFDPSANAALPGIVADEQLERAWAATEARAYGASLAGPALGGFLFGLGRAIPFLGDAVSYLASAATVSRIRGRFRPERAGERTGLWHEAAAGIRLVWSVGLATLAPLTAGLLVQHVSGRWALLTFAAAVGLAAILCTVLPGLRDTGPEPLRR
jgi:Transmembrane secretion effector